MGNEQRTGPLAIIQIAIAPERPGVAPECIYGVATDGGVYAYGHNSVEVNGETVVTHGWIPLSMERLP